MYENRHTSGQARQNRPESTLQATPAGVYQVVTCMSLHRGECCGGYFLRTNYRRMFSLDRSATVGPVRSLGAPLACYVVFSFDTTNRRGFHHWEHRRPLVDSGPFPHVGWDMPLGPELWAFCVNFTCTGFSDVRQEFIRNSSPYASMLAGKVGL